MYLFYMRIVALLTKSGALPARHRDARADV